MNCSLYIFKLKCYCDFMQIVFPKSETTLLYTDISKSSKDTQLYLSVVKKHGGGGNPTSCACLFVRFQAAFILTCGSCWWQHTRLENRRDDHSLSPHFISQQTRARLRIRTCAYTCARGRCRDYANSLVRNA
jgi:hypothetical protein